MIPKGVMSFAIPEDDIIGMQRSLRRGGRAFMRSLFTFSEDDITGGEKLKIDWMTL